MYCISNCRTVNTHSLNIRPGIHYYQTLAHILYFKQSLIMGSFSFSPTQSCLFPPGRFTWFSWSDLPLITFISESIKYSNSSVLYHTAMLLLWEAFMRALLTHVAQTFMIESQIKKHVLKKKNPVQPVINVQNHFLPTHSRVTWQV